MTTMKQKWSETEKVQRFNWRKKIPSKETRIEKATANVARRLNK